MIRFNELRFTPDNKQLIIDASIDMSEWYKDVSIASVVVDNQDTFILEGPSNNPIYIKDFEVEAEEKDVYTFEGQVHNENEATVHTEIMPSRVSHIRLALSEQDCNNINFKDSMLFIYVITSGEPTSPYEEKTQIMGTLINLEYVYKQALLNLRQVENDCCIPKNFIDFMLRYKALELCVQTGNYVQAIKYWKKFFINKKVTFNRCCYGGNN